MPVYTYRGTNRSGGAVSGEVTATSKAELQNLLRRQQITATKMSEKGKEFNLPTFGGSVKAKELAVFTRQFSVMIDAGLPLVQCLEILAGQQENKLFQKVLTGTRSAVEGGATLSAAMRQFPKVFDTLYVNMVEAGETGGILDTILQRLSQYIEKNVKLQRAVKSALVYPVGVLTVAAGVIVLLLWKVVPIFATLFAGLGVALPLPTRIVIGMSNFVGSYFGLAILIAVIGAIFGIKVWYGTTQGRFVLDTMLLNAPLMECCCGKSRWRALLVLWAPSSPAACLFSKAWTLLQKPRETRWWSGRCLRFARRWKKESRSPNRCAKQRFSPAWSPR